jgi:tryptophanyl-tRNA synthetase
MKKILLSGIQPSGELHLGNYFGAIKQFVDLQDSYEAFVMIADLHALTTMQNADELRAYTLRTTAAYLACGLDPAKVHLFRQSYIPEHTELAWVFNCITTVPYLERAHAYKDKVANGKEPSVGLFDYPMLMTADILLYDPAVVPVGADQKQHVEFARDTSEKFNRTWNTELFGMPEPLILAATGIVPGIDGRKMSKSYKNTIPLFASDEEIEKAVMSIVTDSSAGRPENVYAIHKLVRPEAELAALYAENEGKYKALKEALAHDLKAFIAPLRAKYEELLAHPETIEQALMQGESVAKARASEKMNAVRVAIGIR